MNCSVARLQQVMAQCVNCGSCALECPSQVNIPKMAMEAKAQFVRRFGAPLADRLTAEVETAARLTHKLSPLIGPALRRPALRKLAARCSGLAPARGWVEFDRRALYARLPRTIPGSGPRVLYYAGCYAGYIRPALGEAAVQVLAHMGCQVSVPPQACCGLPQLSKGMVASARRAVRRNLAAWQPLLAETDFIAVTCSSCGYALMQDWSYLLDEKTAAQVRAKTIHISELIRRHGDRLALAPLSLRLAYHRPCHLRLQAHGNSSAELLQSLPGIRLDDLQSHCCGMAGSWGMLARNYDLSTTIGAPMIQRLDASGADYGITDCPTCQMQMAHLGHLPIRHPVEIVREAIHAGDSAPDSRSITNNGRG